MTIDKQALREEFRNMQDHYSDPADRERQEIYIAAEALLDENIQLQRGKDAIEAVALALRDDMRQAREQPESLREYFMERVRYYREQSLTLAKASDPRYLDMAAQNEKK